jgi:hypothetical protein
VSFHRVRLDLRVEVSDIEALRETARSCADSSSESMFRSESSTDFEVDSTVIAAALGLILERGADVAAPALTIRGAYVSVSDLPA